MKPNVNPRAMRRAFAKELFAGLRIVWPILSEHIQINARVAELADAPDLGSVESASNESLSLVHVRTLATQTGHLRR